LRTIPEIYLCRICTCTSKCVFYKLSNECRPFSCLLVFKKHLHACYHIFLMSLSI